MATVPAALTQPKLQMRLQQQSSTADVLFAGALIAMDLMIQLSNAKARAVAANKVDSWQSSRWTLWRDWFRTWREA